MDWENIFLHQRGHLYNIRTRKRVGYRRGDGYWSFTYLGKRYYVHRVIFYLVHGYEPPVVDHIDNNPSNNDPANLRAATTQQNLFNINRKGKSKGVSFRKRSGKWRAVATLMGVPKELGEFATKEEAQARYDEYTREHHGEFFNGN